MSMNFFLKVDGVKGGAELAGYVDCIPVLSWSHSFNQPTSPTRSSAGGGTVEQANHTDFSLTKYIDPASTALMKLCWSGKSIKSVVFSALRSDGTDDFKEYLTVTMENVIVSNISISGGTGDLPSETVTLSYSAVKYLYTPTKGEKQQPVRHDLAMQKVE